PPQGWAALLLILLLRRDPGRLAEVLLVDPLDRPVLMDDAVVAVDNDQATAGDRGHLDRGDPEAEVARKPHAEDLVLDRLGVAIDLWLEDVGRWSSFDRATPASIGHPRQDELLLHAGKRDADATSDAQRGAAEVGNELSDFRLSERFGGQGRWIRRRRVVGRLGDQCTG